jgi:hypothetical protein
MNIIEGNLERPIAERTASIPAHTIVEELLVWPSTRPAATGGVAAAPGVYLVEKLTTFRRCSLSSTTKVLSSLTMTTTFNRSFPPVMPCALGL